MARTSSSNSSSEYVHAARWTAAQEVKVADAAKRGRRNRIFTPVTRQLCLQHHASGFGYKKISKVTGIPISTIKYHVRKERAAMHSPIASAESSSSSETTTAASREPAVCAASEYARCTFERSTALVAMLHAVHDAMKKNVYAFARALQHDTHGAPGLARTADPHMLTLALRLLLQDEYADRSELAALARVLHQRLYSAQDFVRAARSLCDTVLAGAESAAAAAEPSPPPTPPCKSVYWACPVCTKRLVHTGKCAHFARCLKKCRVVLSHEQLTAARAAAAAAVAQSARPDELKLHVKSALALKSADDKCLQVRYMQLVAAANTALQHDLEAAPSAILESRELWRCVLAGPDPVVAALALVSLALSLKSDAELAQCAKQQSAARVLQHASELSAALTEQIAGVEAFLARCIAAVVTAPADAHSDECEQHSMQQPTFVETMAPRCTCHRVRISALIHS